MSKKIGEVREKIEEAWEKIEEAWEKTEKANKKIPKAYIRLLKALSIACIFGKISDDDYRWSVDEIAPNLDTAIVEEAFKSVKDYLVRALNAKELTQEKYDSLVQKATEFEKKVLEKLGRQ